MKEIDLNKFENLTLEELRQIATESGIRFAIGNENVKDKEQFFLTLDEAEAEDLERSYIQMLKKRRNEANLKE